MRIFAAIFPPEETLEEILEIQRELRSGLRAKASWTAPEKLHITLRFFGDTHTPEGAIETTERAIESASVFDVSLSSIGGFPTPRRARVGFLAAKPPPPCFDEGEMGRGSGGGVSSGFRRTPWYR